VLPAASLTVVDTDGAVLRIGDVGWVPGGGGGGDSVVW